MLEKRRHTYHHHASSGARPLLLHMAPPPTPEELVDGVWKEYHSESRDRPFWRNVVDGSKTWVRPHRNGEHLSVSATPETPPPASPRSPCSPRSPASTPFPTSSSSSLPSPPSTSSGKTLPHKVEQRGEWGVYFSQRFGRRFYKHEESREMVWEKPPALLEEEQNAAEARALAFMRQHPGPVRPPIVKPVCQPKAPAPPVVPAPVIPAVPPPPPPPPSPPPDDPDPDPPISLLPETSAPHGESEFEKRGCSIALFRAVRDLAVERDAAPGAWTIGAVSALLVGNHEIIKAANRWEGRVDPAATLTHSSESSLIELLQTRHKTEADKHPLLDVCYEGHVSRATVFVSFAYAMNFVELADALECYLAGEGEGAAETTFFWFDLFVNNQWVAADKSFEWWSTTFRTAIQEIGKTVLVLLPWHAPIPLTRAWCLYEIYCSSDLAVALSKKQEESFRDQLWKDYDDIQLSLSKIDLEEATSFNPLDRERIFAVVRQVEAEGGGFSSFNRKVLNLLREWISETARGMKSAKSANEADKYDVSEKVAHLLYRQGKLEEAKARYEEALKGREKLLGPNHFQTLHTVNNLAIVLQEQGKLNAAKALYERALEGFEDTYGLSRPNLTLPIVNNLANLLSDQGKLDEAKELYEKALLGREKLMGHRHPETLETVNNLANLLSDQGKLDEAKVLYERALKSYEEIGRSKYQNTLSVVNNFALLLERQGKLDKAKELYERALSGREEQLGPDHLDTLMTVGNLANLLKQQGKLDEAKPLYERALRGYEEQLGPSHPSALDIAEALASLVEKMGGEGDFNPR